MNKLPKAWSVQRINKYRNQPCLIDGHRFASKAEGKRFSELRLLERGNYIKDLKLQPRFQLKIGDSDLLCTYVGDFSYIDDKGKYILEDVKGVRTPVFRLKKRLMSAILGIQITEIR
mgnify:FL=1